MTKKTLSSLAVLVLLAGGTGCSSTSEEVAADPTPTETAAAESPSPTAEETESDDAPEAEESKDAPEAEESDEAEAEGDDDAEAESAVITIKDFAFSGPKSVAPGATITVQNDDRSPHSVTSEDESFEVILQGGGEKGTFTAPTKPGEYPYICKFHPEMVGTLVVR